MSVLYIVLPLALIIAAAAVVAFVWTVDDGQMDDLESPARRMLHDQAELRAQSSMEAVDNPDRSDEAHR